MLLLPRVMILRSYLRLHLTVLTRASVHLTMVISQEGKRQTLVSSGGHNSWAYDDMRRITLLKHQILFPLIKVEVSP